MISEKNEKWLFYAGKKAQNRRFEVQCVSNGAAKTRRQKITTAGIMTVDKKVIMPV